MKKIIVVLMLLVVANLANSKCFAETALEQLQQAADDGNSAANSYSGGSYDHEGASDTAGYGFDTPSESPPPVDLRGAGDHPTPQLLREPGE